MGWLRIFKALTSFALLVYVPAIILSAALSVFRSALQMFQINNAPSILSKANPFAAETILYPSLMANGGDYNVLRSNSVIDTFSFQFSISFT